MSHYFMPNHVVTGKLAETDRNPHVKDAQDWTASDNDAALGSYEKLSS